MNGRPVAASLEDIDNAPVSEDVKDNCRLILKEMGSGVWICPQCGNIWIDYGSYRPERYCSDRCWADGHNGRPAYKTT